MAGLKSIALVGVGVSFMSLGLVMRKQGRNWRVFFFGGLLTLILAALIIIVKAGA